MLYRLKAVTSGAFMGGIKKALRKGFRNIKGKYFMVIDGTSKKLLSSNLHRKDLFALGSDLACKMNHAEKRKINIHFSAVYSALHI